MWIDIGYFLFELRRTWWPNLKSIWYLFLFLRVIVQNVKLDIYYDTTCAGRHVTASVAAHWHCNIGILATEGGWDSWSLLLFPSRLPEILMGSSNASLNLKHKSSLSHFPPIQCLQLMDYWWCYCVEYLTFVDDVWKERIQLLWIIVEIWACEVLKVSERWHIFCEFPMSD